MSSESDDVRVTPAYWDGYLPNVDVEEIEIVPMDHPRQFQHQATMKPPIPTLSYIVTVPAPKWKRAPYVNPIHAYRARLIAEMYGTRRAANYMRDMRYDVDACVSVLARRPR